MPELPEVEGLALDLRGRLQGRAITRVDIAAFSALKTFDPPLTALAGSFVDDVTRHGKFIDISATGLPCPVCGDPVREVSFADSSLHYCPT